MAADPLLGEIMLFAGNFAPRGWAFCNGQVLPISQNTALFSLLGTTYGGDGKTTFALPDLRGRVPVHAGQGSGLSSYEIGQRGGAETVTLNISDIPTHNHSATSTVMDNGNSGSASICSSGDSTAATPSQAKSFAQLDARNGTLYSSNAPEVGIGPQIPTASITGIQTTVGNTGMNQPHENRMPFQVLNFCIALQGIYPSRS